ncbi:hypothetical protein CU633_01705 [Bacillus sp. V3-13]|uniref:ABC transporter permease n=1 Tax=Bacillus sp. V3-13 TaxID=2053728 RepID=UPI000C787478|nr:ABC transporter permease [Bacillus sp. V3-13]PLR79111.1 hypothetical protein CU633_01705 [Bacillus sp. V3-13]
MSSGKLFLRRLIEEWKFQYRVIQSILDWTIMLYLVVPGIVIFAFIYRSWWVEQPEWTGWMPLEAAFLIGYLVTWSGNYRTFVQEADKVFIIKHPTLFLSMKKWAYRYSLVIQALSILIVTFLLLPFFINYYDVTYIQASVFLILFITVNWFVMAIKTKLRKIDSRPLRIVVTIVVFVALSWVCQFVFLFWEKHSYVLCLVTAACLLVISRAMYVPFLSQTSRFDQEWADEKIERNKYIQLIFQMAPELETPRMTVRKRPWLFRKSKRIFKKRTAENGFIELFIKIFLRNHSYWTIYVQIVSVSSAAILIIPPLWIRSLIGIGFLIMLHSWLGLMWDKITISHPLMKKYGEEDAFFRARKTTVNCLFLIGVLLAVLFVSGSYLVIHFLAP